MGVSQLKTQQNIPLGGAQLQTLGVSFAKGMRIGAGKALGQQSAPRETEIEVGGEERGGVWVQGGPHCCTRGSSRSRVCCQLSVNSSPLKLTSEDMIAAFSQAVDW